MRNEFYWEQKRTRLSVHVLGYNSIVTSNIFITYASIYFQVQIKRSQKLISNLLENGNELLGNVRLAVDNLQVKHQERIEKRDQNLADLLKTQDEEAEQEFQVIEKNWPGEEAAKYCTNSFGRIFL